MVDVLGWTHRLLQHPIQYCNIEYYRKYTKYSRVWWVFLGGPTAPHSILQHRMQEVLDTRTAIVRHSTLQDAQSSLHCLETRRIATCSHVYSDTIDWLQRFKCGSNKQLRPFSSERLLKETLNFTWSSLFVVYSMNTCKTFKTIHLTCKKKTLVEI